MRQDKPVFHDFINRMDQWLVNNCKTLIRFFRKLDEDGEGVLTYEDFKSGNIIVCKILVLVARVSGEKDEN